MDEFEFRIQKLESDLVHLRNGEIGELRDELHNRYLDKYQLMSEYLSRKENERALEKAARSKREWPVILAGVCVALTSISSLLLQVVK